MEPMEESTKGMMVDVAKKITHPAFAKVTVSRVSTSKPVEMFGSGSRHHSFMSVEIATSIMCDEGAMHSHTSSDKLVLSFAMTESQWAAFVSSPGVGDGVCATLQYGPADGYTLEKKPTIETKKTVHEKYSDEVKNRIKTKVEDYSKILEMVKILADNGKANKTQLMELKVRLERGIAGLPETVEYITEKFAKTSEKILNNAKIEFEAYVNTSLVQKGVELLRPGVMEIGNEN